jgi:hypothetical protein
VLPVALEEVILRFPSAPIHGLHRLHEHHVSLGESENFHSYRILRSAKPSARKQRVKRIFLMHTGLNERDGMGLYYRLAGHLVKEDPTTVVVVRPFPGHLTRFPFQAFSETPLDRYLWDGSHLFRQFLRYMIETQWFLSALARKASYRYSSGANLLAESEARESSRLEGSVLAEQMLAAWMSLYEESRLTLKRTLRTQERAVKVKDPPAIEHFKDSIDSLRTLLNLDEDYPGRTADQGSGDADPALHVIGYSLGAFTAQSVFMSWPFLVSSCSTLLGGGALRHLAPSAFAHPEEWQTVLHSLRYELDDRLMSDDVGIKAGSIAGIELEQFTFFKRTFYEVFQQDYRGSFQTRLAAFRKRMLFVVGGNDPVVRPERVIASGPPGGINLLEVGGIGHFLGGRSKDREENQQREFWIPEMASLLSHFSDRATKDQAIERSVTQFDADMASPVSTSKELSEKILGAGGSSGKAASPGGRLTGAEILGIDSDGALPSQIFERCLDDLLARVASGEREDDGVLFMLRNEIPTLLLHDSLIRERAAALYHDDLGIVQYCHGVERRREFVRDNIGGICLTLPWNARSIMERMDVLRGYPSQAESAGGEVRARINSEEAWDACLKECRQLTQGSKVAREDGRDSVRRFNGNRLLSEVPANLVPEELLACAKEMAGQEDLAQVASLPDCWVWVSRGALGVNDGVALTVKRAIRELSRIVPDFCEGADRDERLLETLRTDQIRIVTVSRARYNPRFRGRLIVTPKSARKLLVHVALSLVLSEPIDTSKSPVFK